MLSSLSGARGQASPAVHFFAEPSHMRAAMKA